MAKRIPRGNGTSLLATNESWAPGAAMHLRARRRSAWIARLRVTYQISEIMKHVFSLMLVFIAATFAACKSQDVAQVSDSQEYTLAVSGMT